MHTPATGGADRLRSVRLYLPAYLEPKSWVGLRLDLADVDWGQIAERVRMAYRLVTAKRLAAQVAPADD
jgi:hypothetical protein